MRVVCQRVLQAKVETKGQTIGQIDKGLLVYLSVGKEDTLKDAQFMADKLVNLRIFADEAGKPRPLGMGEGKMNRSVLDVGGSILLVSNFTLHGDCRKGRRPGFDAAAEPEIAQQLYEKVIDLVTEKGVSVEKGVFGEYMQVASNNDGPVTYLHDSSRLF